jgi:hypothetical protein
MTPLLLATVALALTPPDPGAVALPAGIDLTLPFPEGVEVVVTCGYGPSCSSFHVGTDRTGSTNDYYALDMVRNTAGGGSGEAIVAAYDGEVVYADWASGGWSSFGRIVLVEHDFGDGHTYTTLYAHLSALSVSVGDTVAAKEEIGRMGGSGNYVDGWFGAHLHFSLYQDASFIGGPYGGHAVVPELIDGQGDLDHGDLLLSGTGGAPTPTAIVDDLDPGFTLSGPAMEHSSGGYGPDDHFFYQPAEAVGSATTWGTWTPDIPEDGLYKVQAFIPYSSHATATLAPFTVHAHGHVEGTTQDQSIIGGDFHDLFGGDGFKMLAGERAQVTLDNGSGDPSANHVAFDALRFVKVGDAGTAGLGDPCSDSAACEGDLVCGPGTCVDDCLVGGCGGGGTCDEVTGLCDVWPGGTTEPSTTDTGLSDPTPEPTDDPSTDDPTGSVPSGTRPAGSGTAPPKPESGGCRTAPGGALSEVLNVLATRRR